MYDIPESKPKITGCPVLGDRWAVGWRNELAEQIGLFRSTEFFCMPLIMSTSYCTVVKAYKRKPIA